MTPHEGFIQDKICVMLPFFIFSVKFKQSTDEIEVSTEFNTTISTIQQNITNISSYKKNFVQQQIEYIQIY